MFDEDLFGGSGSDPYFVATRDDQRFLDVRRLCLERWESHQELADPHFVEEFSHDFHARFWEMELSYRLTTFGFRLTSSPSGPDLRADGAGEKGTAYVEATAVKRGEPPNGIPRLSDRDKDDDSVPFDSFVLRLTAAIQAKANSSQEVESCAPYVVAVNLPQPEVWICGDPPLSAQACLGVGAVVFDLTSGRRSAVPRSLLRKANGEPVDTCFFLQESSRHVSAVIVTSVNPFVRPFCASAELLHNPRASNPLPRGWFSSGNEYWLDASVLKRREHDVL